MVAETYTNQLTEGFGCWSEQYAAQNLVSHLEMLKNKYDRAQTSTRVSFKDTALTRAAAKGETMHGLRDKKHALPDAFLYIF